jgi:hypothetical protein
LFEILDLLAYHIPMRDQASEGDIFAKQSELKVTQLPHYALREPCAASDDEVYGLNTLSGLKHQNLVQVNGLNLVAGAHAKELRSNERP